MKLRLRESVIRCDVLVIGGGGAGLRSAIAARGDKADVLLASKYRAGRATNTYISKAIIAASGWGPSEDGAVVHADDTMAGGRFLNDPSKVSLMAARITPEIDFLRDCGVKFGMKDGRLRLMKTPGHRHPRHVYGENWTGSDLVLPLAHRARQAGVRMMDRVFISKLLTVDGRIAGAAGVTPDGGVLAIRAKAVVLATGGFARLYLNSNNASGITGDGLALAFDAGAALQDMEFVQFYPTALGKRGNRLLLYEKLLARKGVALTNSAGEDILLKNGRDPTRITRDQLARIMMREIMDDAGGAGRITMDLGALSDEAAQELAQLLPSSWRKGQRRFSVAPTTHFCMGGIVTDQQGQTACPGLFAAGEAAAGAHGANRLGGNALAEVFAMGALIGSAAADHALSSADGRLWNDTIARHFSGLEAMVSDEGAPPGELIRELKTLMWRKAGIIRERAGLEEALARIRNPWPKAAVKNPRDLVRRLEFDNMRLIAEMVCAAALQRTESRGSHFRVDFPEEDNDSWLKNIVFSKGADGPVVETMPVPGPA